MNENKASLLNTVNAGEVPADEKKALGIDLDRILTHDLKGDVLQMMADFQRILGDNHQRERWGEIFHKLDVLFRCGSPEPLDGPMIGVSMGIRDTDYFRKTAGLFGENRSVIANLEWMATAWNATFSHAGLWMGKTFEPVERQDFAARCRENPEMMRLFDPATARIGRNFFREIEHPDLIQSLGLPVLTKVWRLVDRPLTPQSKGIAGQLLIANLEKEKAIPYNKTGGLFLAAPGKSVAPELRDKPVYQLNYRWPGLDPVFPMTRLVDELVKIADGVYLGQLVMASRHYSLGRLDLPIFGGGWELGEAYGANLNYGYQNNGYFLMIDPAFARAAYDDKAFPFLRPRRGEIGYLGLGYEDLRPGAGAVTQPLPPGFMDWTEGWRRDETLYKKFTTMTLEPSSKASDGDVRRLLMEDESILQMLQRIQKNVNAALSHNDHLQHFETLNQLFRAGVAPRVENGLFQGTGFNTRFDAPEKRQWYGQSDPCSGFDYYHGATLALHFGFADTFCRDRGSVFKDCPLVPTALLEKLDSAHRGPGVLNAVWAAIGRFIFPWAGKSFERISPRKLSMLLDESVDLRDRYPERVEELKCHPASWPYYDLVLKNRDHHWREPGVHAAHLRNSWDQGMSAEERAYWEKEAAQNWVFGNNLQDERILPMDALFKALDMNYVEPMPSIQKLVKEGPSPFVRQGYAFLGTSDRESILPMNHGESRKKVFQFHYRYPMLGGALPIGFCLDELVELASGLFLGQLIYSTALAKGFHSSVDPSEYQYQLFGYFLLMDDAWEQHRQAIGFDVNL